MLKKLKKMDKKESEITNTDPAICFETKKT